MGSLNRLKNKFTSSFAPVDPSVGMLGYKGLDNEFSALDLGDNYLNSRKRGRDDKNRDAASIEEQNKIAQEMATLAKNKYINGELNPGQDALIDKFTRGQRAQLRQKLASSGMADSSTRVLEEGNIDSAAVGMKDQMLDQEFSNTMQALGMSAEASQIMASFSDANKTQAMAIYSSFSQAIGTWAGQTSTDKGGTQL